MTRTPMRRITIRPSGLPSRRRRWKSRAASGDLFLHRSEPRRVFAVEVGAQAAGAVVGPRMLELPGQLVLLVTRVEVGNRVAPEENRCAVREHEQADDDENRPETAPSCAYHSSNASASSTGSVARTRSERSRRVSKITCRIDSRTGPRLGRSCAAGYGA